MYNKSGKAYIICTQQSYKNRMSRHFADVNKYACNNIYTDSYIHKIQHYLFKFLNIPSPTKLKGILSFKILWKGNMVSLTKSFGLHACKLCMKKKN